MSNNNILCALACNLDTHILQAALPLFASEKVEAIEWSFDALFRIKQKPDWFVELLKVFSSANRLVGHGIYFSLFSGKWVKEQEEWLAHLASIAKEYPFDHVTEHFGFMTGANFHQGAPIGIPYTKNTLAIGVDRLKRIHHACECPVGLENLAFSYSLEEVEKHGAFLDELVEPVNGFIILDLHNFYCQLHNFKVAYEDLINLYPLHRVREIHISGGTWEDSRVRPNEQIRRDTHDDAVPEAVFELLEKTIPKCPNLKYVVLEQIGLGLKSAASKKQFQQDFLKLCTVVAQQNQQLNQNITPNNFMPSAATPAPASTPLEDVQLHEQQLALSKILETAPTYQQAQVLLQQSSLANTAWQVEDWDAAMLDTAMEIAQKWKGGFK